MAEQCTVGNAVGYKVAAKLRKVVCRAKEMQFHCCWVLIPGRLSED